MALRQNGGLAEIALLLVLSENCGGMRVGDVRQWVVFGG